MGGRIALGIPVCGLPSWHLVRSLMSLEWPDEQRAFITAGEYDRPLPIDAAHNRIIETFLAEPRLEWLFMVDADATLHPQTLLRLLSWNRPIVGALCFSRYPPPHPTIYAGHPANAPEGHSRIHIDETRAWLESHSALVTNAAALLDPRPADALVEVDFTGAHCLLVHRTVLEAIAAPWFERLLSPSELGTGADRDFCQKARAKGFSVCVDRSVVAGHLSGEHVIAALDFLVWDRVTDWKRERPMLVLNEAPAKPSPWRHKTLTVGEGE